MSYRLLAAQERCGLPGTATTSSNPTPSSSSDAEASGHELGACSDDILARLLRLAEQEAVDTLDRPPIDSYTVAAGPHGDVYRATDEWVAWMRRRTPGYGEDRRGQRPPTRRAPEETGAPDSDWRDKRMKKEKPT